MRTLAYSCILVFALSCGPSGANDQNGSTGTGQPAGTHRLTVSIEGSGRVVSNPAGIDCTSPTCSADFPDGTSVALNATSGPDSSFARWAGGRSGAGDCSIAMRADAQVVAHFDPVDQPPPPPPAPPPAPPPPAPPPPAPPPPAPPPPAPPPPAPPAHVTVAVTGPGHVGGPGIDCGNGATTCDVRLPIGSAVTFTASAASNARFQGWGGACSGASATCSATAQGDLSVTAAFVPELATLFPSDGTGLNLQDALAMNSKDLFFFRVIDNHVSIWAVAKSGGPPRLVADAAQALIAANNIVADDAFVYFAGYQNPRAPTVSSVPVGGGDVSTIFFLEDAESVVGSLALDQGALYFTVRKITGGPETIHRMQDRVDQVIAAGVPTTAGLAVDSQFVYFAFFSKEGNGIARVDKRGGTPFTVVLQDAGPLVVRVDSQNLYWRNGDGIFAAAKDGAGAHRVSGNPGTSFLHDFEVNASVVWWIWLYDPPLGPKGLFRANSDGSEFTPVDTASEDNWGAGPRVDDTAAYYWHMNSLMKRLK